MNVVQSTPAEVAARIVRQYIPDHLKFAIGADGLAEDIRRAIVDGNSAEVAKRRHAEQILEGCCLAGVMVVCEADRTYLKAYNVKSGKWATLPMTEVDPA